MRNLIYVFIVFLFSGCITAKYSKTDYPDPFEFNRVDSVSGSKNELYVRAHEWVAKSFVNANEVIQMNDKDAGKLIAKGIMTSDVPLGAMVGTAHYQISFTISIDVKQDKYRVSMKNYTLVSGRVSGGTGNPVFFEYNTDLSGSKHPSTMYPKAWANVKGDCYYTTKELLKSLKSAMHNSDEF
jgi:hypothetical protein